jgi:hypothetical protein
MNMRFQILMAASMKMTASWDIAPCSLVEVDAHFRGALVMEAVHTSQTLVYFNETTHCYIPEGSHLHDNKRSDFTKGRGFPDILSNYQFFKEASVHGMS